MPENRRPFRLIGLCMLLGISGCAGPGGQQEAGHGNDPALAADLARQAMGAWEQGEQEAAVEAWRRALILNPEDPVVVNNLALALKEQHRFGEAAELLERAVARSPEVAELHYNLAVIAELYLLDLDKALTHYRRYRDLTLGKDTEVAGWIADLERRLE